MSFWLVDRTKLTYYFPIYVFTNSWQDVTQGQFWSAVKQVWIQSFRSPRLVAESRLKKPVWRENNWIHTFLNSICAMWKATNLVQDLNSCPFPTTITIRPRSPPYMEGEEMDSCIFESYKWKVKMFIQDLNLFRWLYFIRQ